MSVRRLANLARIDPSYLSRVERGRLPPPQPPAIARLAAILQIDPRELTAFARRLPEDVSQSVFQRPKLMMRLILAAGRYDDDHLDRICHALERIDPPS